MAPRRSIIAHHLILTGYGHWLPNDIRGSGSTEVRKPQLRELGEIHHGRKRVQPERHDLRAFMRRAEPMLTHSVLWFDEEKRRVLSEAFAATLTQHRYTCWACAVCSNHAHLIIRVHRDKGDAIWDRFAQASREHLQSGGFIPAEHPLWADRPYAVFLKSTQRVHDCIRYVNENPVKEHLPAQSHAFVQPYNNWPHHKH